MRGLLDSTILAPGFALGLALVLAGAACTGKTASAPAHDDTAAQGQAAGSAAADQAATPDSAADQAAVRKVFEDYKSAITERRGNDAAALVDKNTLGFYAKCRDLALTATRDQLLPEGLFVRLTTLMLRVRVPVDQLAAMDARQMVVHAVDQGWVGDVAGLGIGEISVTADRAAAKVPGAPDHVAFEFRRQDGAWKIDLTSIFDFAEQAMRQQFVQAGMDENQAIVELIGMLAPVPDNVWEPLR